jgi:hypothetical protein
LVLSTAPSGEGTAADPSPAQLAQLLSSQMPQADIKIGDTRIAIDSSLAESDFQLFLTQLVLALTMGFAGGYIRFGDLDGMVGIGVIFALVTCFRNSLLGMCLGATLGAVIAPKVQNKAGLFETPVEALIPLMLFGAFLGSFLGNYWRRFCPVYLRPSTSHQKPPGVA